jgi:hypothetical protein
MGSFLDAFDRSNFNQSDVFWRNDQNFHVYEQAFRASHPAPGSSLVWDTAGEESRFAIGLAKARALDKARKNLILAAHAKAVEEFGASTANQVTRSVDGVEGAPDSAIKL